jgi:hypothetical protein
MNWCLYLGGFPPYPIEKAKEDHSIKERNETQNTLMNRSKDAK